MTFVTPSASARFSNMLMVEGARSVATILACGTAFAKGRAGLPALLARSKIVTSSAAHKTEWDVTQDPTAGNAGPLARPTFAFLQECLHNLNDLARVGL